MRAHRPAAPAAQSSSPAPRPDCLDGFPIGVSTHACERYIERLDRPHLSISEARRELRKLFALGTVTARPPKWAKPSARADAWVTVADVAAPLVWQGDSQRLLATSLIVRGTLSTERRSRRNRERAIRTSDRIWRGKDDRPRRPEQPVEEWAS